MTTIGILSISYPDGRNDAYPIDKGEMTVGSSESCEVAVQEPDIAPEHFRLFVREGSVYVRNLQSPEKTIFEGSPLEDEKSFPIGGVIRAGNVQFSLRPSSQSQPFDGTESQDGTVSQVNRIRTELGMGWRGYRRVLSWLSETVSPAEAERAEAVFNYRSRILLAVLSAIVLLVASVIGAESLCHFATVTVLRRILVAIVFLSSILLRSRCQIAFAGRALFLVAVPAFFVDPPDTSIAEADIMLDVWRPAGVFCAFVVAGWAVDFGACVLRLGSARKVLRWIALVLVATLAGTAENYFAKGSSGMPYYEWLLAALPFMGLALSAVPRIKQWLGNSAEIPDVENVVEIAFSRQSKTIGGKWLALIGVSGVTLLLLLGLNARESMDWRSRKDALLIDTEFAELPWFWDETRSFLEKADFDKNNVFFIPESSLLASLSNPMPDATGTEDEESYRSVILWRARKAHIWALYRKWLAAQTSRPEEEVDSEWNDKVGPALRKETDKLVLTPLGERIGTLLDDIDANHDDENPYKALLGELAQFRKTAADADWIADHLGTDVIAINASEEAIRPSAAHPHGRTYHRARPKLGANTQDPQAIDLASFRIQASLFPCLIAIILAFLFLWSRGGDSQIGLWIGIYMVGLAFSSLSVDFAYLFEEKAHATELADVSENLTRHALLAFHSMSEASAIGAIAHFVFLLVYGGAWVFVFLSGLAQTVLFLMLCWPTAGTGSMRGIWGKRILKFVGFLLASVSIATLAIIMGANVVIARLVSVMAIVVVGALLRRRTRERTEVPSLGWEFAAAWLMMEASVYFVTVPFNQNAGWLHFVSNPIRVMGWVTTPGFFICAATAACAAMLCFRMCLRRGFLQMLTPGRAAFAVFAVAVPCLAEFSEQLVGMVFEGSVLSSRIGDELLGILVVVLLFSPCWNLLTKQMRRLSVRRLPQVEREASRALESLFDEDPALDFRDALHASLAEIPILRYAVFARVSNKTFALVASRGVPDKLPDRFEASRHLQRRLAKDCPTVDFSTLAYDRSLFFHSFELQRIGIQLSDGTSQAPAGCLLPIRLGTSLRGFLFAPDNDENASPELANEEISETVNNLGLATIASARSIALTEE